MAEDKYDWHNWRHGNQEYYDAATKAHEGKYRGSEIDPVKLEQDCGLTLTQMDLMLIAEMKMCQLSAMEVLCNPEWVANPYGSTEKLEERLKALFFGQNPNSYSVHGL